MVTGDVERYDEAGVDPQNGYDNIARVDIEEYKRWAAMASSLPIDWRDGDILDVGYWKTDGTYVVADSTSREHTLEY